MTHGVDTLFALEADPFDLTPNGVPVDMLGDVEEYDTESSYLRVDADILDDEGVGDLTAECGAAGLGVWVAVLAEAKAARSFGLLSMNAASFGGRISTPGDVVLEAVRSMERAGLVWARIDGRRVTLRVRRWHRWQRMTEAERSRWRRAREGASAVGGGLAGAHEVSDRDSRSATKNPGRATKNPGQRPVGDRGTETGDRSPPPLASAPEPARVREAAMSPVDRITEALAAMYPEPGRAAEAAQAMWSGAFMRKARFVHGLTAEAIIAGIADLTDHRRRDPSFAPRDVVEYVCGRAAKWNPNAPDLSLPTTSTETPDARHPTFASDPRFSEFDG